VNCVQRLAADRRNLRRMSELGVMSGTAVKLFPRLGALAARSSQPTDGGQACPFPERVHTSTGDPRDAEGPFPFSPGMPRLLLIDSDSADPSQKPQVLKTDCGEEF